MKKEKTDILSKIGKDAGFSVPDGYFDTFAEDLAKKLPEPVLTPVQPVTRWQRVRPFVYMAAMFVGIWLMMKIFDGFGRQEPGIYNPEILAGFENDANIEYLLMRGDISEYDILTYENDDTAMAAVGEEYMNRSIFSLIIAFVVFPFVAAFAHEEQADTANAVNSRRAWIANVKDYKYQMLEREAQMTEAQAEQFFPLYQEMEEKVFMANLEARRMEMRVSDNFDTATDEDFRQAAQALSDVKVREAEIEQEYYPQFARILSDKQMFLLKRAETHFASDMLRHYNRSREINAQ